MVGLSVPVRVGQRIQPGEVSSIRALFIRIIEPASGKLRLFLGRGVGRNRIQSARSKRMATQNTPHRQAKPARDPMRVDRLDGVLAACGMELAHADQQRPHATLITAYQRDDRRTKRTASALAHWISAFVGQLIDSNRTMGQLPGQPVRPQIIGRKRRIQ